MRSLYFFMFLFAALVQFKKNPNAGSVHHKSLALGESHGPLGCHTQGTLMGTMDGTWRGVCSNSRHVFFHSIMTFFCYRSVFMTLISFIFI